MSARATIESLVEHEYGEDAARRNRETLVQTGEYTQEEVDRMTNMEVHAALQREMNKR